MNINIPDEVIQKYIEEQVDKSVRKRIKEMQNNYTNKGYIQNLITEVVWNRISELVPDVDKFIKAEVHRCLNGKINSESNKITKEELTELMIDKLLKKMK